MNANDILHAPPPQGWEIVMLGNIQLRVGFLGIGPRGGVVVIDKDKAETRRVPRSQQFHFQRCIEE